MAFGVIFATWANLVAVAVRFHGVPKALGAAFFLLLLGPVLAHLVAGRRTLVCGSSVIMLLAYGAAMLLSAATSRDPGASSEPLITFAIEGILLFVLILNAVRSKRSLRAAIWAIALAATLMGATTTYQGLTRSYDQQFGGFAQVSDARVSTELGRAAPRHRLEGPIGEQNRYAQILLVALPLFLVLWRTESDPRLRLVVLAGAPLVLLALLFTYSRGAFVALGLTLVALVLLRMIRPLPLLLAGSAAAVLLVLAAPEYLDRILSLGEVFDLLRGDTGGVGLALRGRAAQSIGAFLIFLDHPILGVGPGQSRAMIPAYANALGLKFLQGEKMAHNLFLEEMADLGLLGFLPFLALAGGTLVGLYAVGRGRRDSRPGFTALGLFASLTAFLACGLFLHLSYERYYWLLLALSTAAIRIGREERRDPGSVPLDS